MKAKFTESHVFVASSKKPQNVGKTMRPKLYDSVTSEDVLCTQKTKNKKNKKNKTKKQKHKNKNTKKVTSIVGYAKG
jgi:hypothetical protein